MPLGPWLRQGLAQSPGMTGWIAASGLLATLLAINTLCCFIDWCFSFRARWRKSGEYLIHLGFVLILIAFWWGSLAGFRSEKNPVLVGQSLALPQPGLSLKLEAINPVLTPSGRPMEILNTLSLYRDGTLLTRVKTRSNHPLLWKGLVAVPVSFGQTRLGGRVLPYSVLTVSYDPGAKLAFAGSLLMGGGVLLALFSFYRKRARGDRPDIR